MSKPARTPRKPNSSRSSEEGSAAGPAGSADSSRALKSYRPPEVRKRRSLSQATLVSGGGVSGVLAGGNV